MKKNTLTFLILLLSCAALFFGGCGLAAGDGSAPHTVSESPAATEAPSVLPTLLFSEAMSSNKAGLALPDGSFPDWLELYNAGENAAELEGYVLECGKKSWRFPVCTLEAGQFLLVYCDKGASDGDGMLHSSFALSKDGEELRLLAPDGTLLDQLSLPALEEDQSFSLRGGLWTADRLYSPGYENTDAGYQAFQESRVLPNGLGISELMVYNDWYVPYFNAFYDWVELCNFGTEELELSDYYLSDKNGTRFLFRLPKGVLAPGESRVILCSEDCPSPEAADFGLSSGGESLFLTRKDGTLCDYASLWDIPVGRSVGREMGRGGYFFFASPSPGEANSGGLRFVGQPPVSLGQDGVFEDVSSVTVELEGPGEIRYTLDGSVPTEKSAVYTKPFRVKKTTVVRAVSFQPDHLPSDPLSLSYILNEGHSLPVVSVLCEPEELFGAARGIYQNPAMDWERPACVMYFGDDGSFRLNCGIKLHGATSRLEQAKKSFKLCFRDRYEGLLHYDLFDNGVLDFESILLRADQESSQSTYMHDTLMHQLSLRAFPELPAQDYRYAVLYLNGNYWGIYTIREAHSARHYAEHYGYGLDTVSHWKSDWPDNSIIEDVYTFARQSDLSIAENYDFVSSHIDVDSVIAWCVIQLYSGNFDFHSPNMRFYYSTEDELMRYALVDLDLSFFGYGSFQDIFGLGYDYNTLPLMLMQNENFRFKMMRAFSEALAGPLADAEVLALIDELAAQLSPEIERDCRRWNYSVSDWNSLVEDIREYITMNMGRAQNVIDLMRTSGFFHQKELAEVFP